jgi:subtilisin family serine protease
MPMNVRVLNFLFVIVVTSFAALAADDNEDLTRIPPDKAVPAAAIQDRFIIEVRAGINPRLVAPAHGIPADYFYQHAVNGFAGNIPAGRLAALAADPRVVRIVPDRAVAANAKPDGGGGATSAQVVPAGIQRIGASPGATAYTGAGVGVAVVDTGVDFNHADLQPLGAASFSTYAGSAQDGNGHGTHVAGTIGARNNSMDVVGVAPNATIYAVKVLDDAGNGFDSTIIAGLDWVAANAALVSPRIRVVNMSLGREGTLNDNHVFRAAIQNLTAAGVAVIVAAGNDASLEVSQQVPSGYPEVIAVASSTAKAGRSHYRLFNGVVGADTASYFTSDGAFNSRTHIGVSISGPGEDQENVSKEGFIESVGILSTKLGGGTTRLSGSSMASPHTAGVAALIWQKAVLLGQTVSPEDIRARIRAGASNPSAPLDSPTTGYTFDGVREGILSVSGALAP